MRTSPAALKRWAPPNGDIEFISMLISYCSARRMGRETRAARWTDFGHRRNVPRSTVRTRAGPNMPNVVNRRALGGNARALRSVERECQYFID